MIFSSNCPKMSHERIVLEYQMKQKYVFDITKHASVITISITFKL